MLFMLRAFTVLIALAEKPVSNPNTHLCMKLIKLFRFPAPEIQQLPPAAADGARLGPLGRWYHETLAHRRCFVWLQGTLSRTIYVLRCVPPHQHSHRTRPPVARISRRRYVHIATFFYLHTETKDLTYVFLPLFSGGIKRR